MLLRVSVSVGACVRVCVSEQRSQKAKEGLVRLCAPPHALITQHQRGMNEHQ